MIKDFYSITEIAEIYNISRGALSNYFGKNKHLYKHDLVEYPLSSSMYLIHYLEIDKLVEKYKKQRRIKK